MFFAPLSSETLVFADAKKEMLAVFLTFPALGRHRSYHKIIKNTICLEHFGARMELSLKRRASDVHRLIAGVANPFARTAICSLGALPDFELPKLEVGSLKL